MKRGDIYVVDLGPGVGREVAGPSPVVVVSGGVSGTAPLFLVVVPAVGTGDIRAPMGILVSSADTGHTEDIAVIARQPRALDVSRFPDQPSGTVPDSVMEKIGRVIVFELDLKP